MVELAPHQQRVVDEKNEISEQLKVLVERRDKLKDFIENNEIYKSLPEEDRIDLSNQSTIMNNCVKWYDLYVDVLEHRISRF